MKDDLLGWVNVSQVKNLCKSCKNTLVEQHYSDVQALAACEYGQRWFPRATKCLTYEPDDLYE